MEEMVKIVSEHCIYYSWHQCSGLSTKDGLSGLGPML